MEIIKLILKVILVILILFLEKLMVELNIIHELIYRELLFTKCQLNNSWYFLES